MTAIPTHDDLDQRLVSAWERETRARLLALRDEDGTIEGASARRAVHPEYGEDWQVLELLGDGWETDEDADEFRRACS